MAMLDYPNNFDTAIFPEARRIALSRFFAVWSMIALILVAAGAGAIYWTIRAQRLNPFMISISNDGRWSAIGENTTARRTFSAAHLMQESVAVNYARMWFATDADQTVNSATWAACEPGDRATPGGMGSICQISGPGVFKKFTDIVLLDRVRRAANGEIWHLDEKSIAVRPVRNVSDAGSMWQINARLVSNKTAPRNIVAFALVVRSPNARPMTMGYYVADFHSYAVTEIK
ncbi:MAG: hypothetical protein FWE52_03300 [Alphaproteobacteria bacterium]|nr:hypothetical protein [Alphaproteobacteria bacterium]